MTPSRLAQGLLALTTIAMFLTWSSDPTESVAGVQGGPGQLVMLASIIGIILVHLELRPAWIAAGLAAVISVREILRIGDAEQLDAGVGLWAGAVFAAIATGLLVWKMFADVKRPDATE